MNSTHDPHSGSERIVFPSLTRDSWSSGLSGPYSISRRKSLPRGCFLMSLIAESNDRLNIFQTVLPDTRWTKGNRSANDIDFWISDARNRLRMIDVIFFDDKSIYFLGIVLTSSATILAFTSPNRPLPFCSQAAPRMQMTSTPVAHKSGSSSFLIEPAIHASFLCLWHSLTKDLISLREQ